MKENRNNKYFKDEIIDQFLKEYFIFDSILDRTFDRKKLLGIVYNYMGIIKENLDKLYDLLQDEDLKLITNMSDYNRTNRILEYNRLYNNNNSDNSDLLHLIQIKGNALSLLYKNKLDVVTSSDSYQELINLSLKGNVLAMRVTGVMYIEGIYFNKNLKKGLSLLRKTAKWNDINSCFALLYYSSKLSKDELSLYNIDKKELTTILNTLIESNLYDSCIDDIYSKFNLDTNLMNKTNNDVKLVKKGISSLRLDENKYEKNYSRLLFSRIISNKDKEKILFSDFKGLLSSACDLPLQLDYKYNLINNIPNPFNNLKVNELINNAFRKIPLLTNDNYKPLSIVSESKYILNEYNKYFEEVFEDSNIIKVNLSGLTLYDLEQNENNIFLRNIDDSKNNVIVLNMTDYIDNNIIRLVSKFISSKERKMFNVTNLSLTLDLSKVLVICLMDNQNANYFKDLTEVIKNDKLTECDVLNEIDMIINIKKDEYSIESVCIDDELKSLLKVKPIDEVYSILDESLRNSYGLSEAILNKDLLNESSNVCNHYGFGGFQYENK